MSELHSLAALRQAADHLRAEERHWWADTIMAAIETLTRDDSAAEAIERVRALHGLCHTCSPARDPHCDCCDEDWPCLTISALYGGGTDE